MHGLEHSENVLVHVGTKETIELGQCSSGRIKLAPPVLVHGLKHSEKCLVHLGTKETTELGQCSSGWI